MARCALKFAVRMQKVSSLNRFVVECVSMVLNCLIRFRTVVCASLCLRLSIIESRSFIHSPLQDRCIEKLSGGCKANGNLRLVRRGGKDGMLKIFFPRLSLHLHAC